MISNVQEKLRAPKSQYNSFGKYSYRSTEDILAGLKPLLAKEHAVLTLDDELVLIGERYYVKSTARYSDADGTYSSTGYAREADRKKGMDDSQVTGTASSYARKYALNGLFLIDDTKDADSQEYHRQTGGQKKTAARKPTGKTSEEKAIEAKKKQYGVIVQKLSGLTGDNESAIKSRIFESAKKSGDTDKATTPISKWNTLINHGQLLYNKIRTTQNKEQNKGDMKND